MDKYNFPTQFACMYCKIDLDPDNKLALGIGGQTDLKCPSCGAIWKFFAKIYLNHRLVQGGRYNK